MQAKILAAALVLVVVLPARESRDVIVLENGDHMTGEIKGLNAGVLRVSLDYVDGTISVEWSKVKRVKASNYLLSRSRMDHRTPGRLPALPGNRARSGSRSTRTRRR